MRKATQKSKLTNPGGGNVEIEGRLRTRRGEAPESEVATDKVSNNDSKQSAETERESTASPSRITRMLKYVPYLFLVGLMIASFVLAIRSESPANSSSSTGVCWDKKIRIRVIPDEACRTLYINMSMKTPFLLLIIYALVHAYLSQLTGMLSTFGRILGLVSGDAVWLSRRLIVYGTKAQKYVFRTSLIYYLLTCPPLVGFLNNSSKRFFTHFFFFSWSFVTPLRPPMPPPTPWASSCRGPHPSRLASGPTALLRPGRSTLCRRL